MNYGVACVYCGEPATCFGSYEGSAACPACDECCGHGNEDGSCRSLDEIAEAMQEQETRNPRKR